MTFRRYGYSSKEPEQFRLNKTQLSGKLWERFIAFSSCNLEFCNFGFFVFNEKLQFSSSSSSSSSKKKKKKKKKRLPTSVLGK
jgi:hypothetical protein